MNLAQTKRSTSGVDSAIITLRSALEVLSHKEGRQSDNAAQARNNLAVLLEETGDYLEAERLYREAIEVWEISLPSNHPSLIRAWHNLGMLLRDRDNPTEALGYYSKVVSGYREHGTQYRKRLGDALNGLAKVQALVGDLAGAAASFRESLSIREAELPADHWRIGTAKSLLGEALGMLGEREEAEYLLASGLEVLRSARGPDDEKTLEAQKRLTDFHARPLPLTEVSSGTL